MKILPNPSVCEKQLWRTRYFCGYFFAERRHQIHIFKEGQTGNTRKTQGEEDGEYLFEQQKICLGRVGKHRADGGPELSLPIGPVHRKRCFGRRRRRRRRRRALFSSSRALASSIAREIGRRRRRRRRRGTLSAAPACACCRTIFISRSAALGFNTERGF